MWWYRLLGLLAFFALTTAIDRWRRGAASTRAGDTALALAAAGIAGLFGASFDQLTVSLSPEYFRLGKGLAGEGSGLRLAAAELGFQAGFSAGLIAILILMILNRPAVDRQVLARPRVFVLGLWLIPGALICSPLGAALSFIFDPFKFKEQLTGLLPDDRHGAFRIAQGLHLGLYFGALASLILAARRLRIERRLKGLADAG